MNFLWTCVMVLIMLVPFSLEASQPRKVCPALTLKNGRVRIRGGGRMAYFRCKKKYKRVGHKLAVCLSRGTWSQQTPVCVGRGCPDLGALPDLTVTEMYKGGILRFTCPEGMRREGPQSLMCDGTNWDKEPPKCLYGASLGCDFEDSALCGWSQDSDDDFDWTWTSGYTPTTETGPDADHTTGSGHYIFMESSAPQKFGQVTRLISPPYQPPAEPMCLEFYYHMKGPKKDQEVGDLDVMVRTSNDNDDDEDEPNKDLVVFHREGYQDDDWVRGFVTIPAPADIFKIVFAATRRQGWSGDIALDDIKVFNCSEMPVTNATTAPTTPLPTTTTTTPTTTTTTTTPTTTTTTPKSTTPTTTTTTSPTEQTTTPTTTMTSSPPTSTATSTTSSTATTTTPQSSTTTTTWPTTTTEITSPSSSPSTTTTFSSSSSLLSSVTWWPTNWGTRSIMPGEISSTSTFMTDMPSSSSSSESSTMSTSSTTSTESSSITSSSSFSSSSSYSFFSSSSSSSTPSYPPISKTFPNATTIAATNTSTNSVSIATTDGIAKEGNNYNETGNNNGTSTSSENAINTTTSSKEGEGEKEGGGVGDDNASKGQKSGSSSSADVTDYLPLIIGVSLGLIVGVVVVGILAWLWARNRRKQKEIQIEEDQLNIIGSIDGASYSYPPSGSEH